ncbi:cytochrome c biogenesis protein CcsA [Deinococcus peraridilitoris]|uniref:Heme exporter protein C n=1 Tax=Deinococcus peraridilitoris (strain DSM 19664 / LMG 22246 / CIP 109416 / KR-200) TaxID=937777 RepID=K9ZZK6_DEIPD|nr:cytochrome c biogenesis protein CcsA [Deinococcus peraridilitoris]AFZ66372.1 ABC-type transport system involved in cytochrome c biogenesis, permease component [Deinococcus peraridilitoris DSM 19664]
MRDRLTPVLGLLTLAAFVIGLYFAFTSPPDVNQGDLVRIMYLHVPSAWLSYLAYGGTFVFGLGYLLTRRRHLDRLAAASAEIGLLFTALTLLGGSLWARPTWGAYWTWDPRLTTTALSLVIYGGYFIVRGLIDEPDRRARVASVIGVMGTLYIPVNYMSVYWWRSIHQTPTVQLLGKTHLAADPRMLSALFVMLGAFTLLYLLLLRLRGKLAAKVEAREEHSFARMHGETPTKALQEGWRG